LAFFTNPWQDDSVVRGAVKPEGFPPMPPRECREPEVGLGGLNGLKTLELVQLFER